MKIAYIISAYQIPELLIRLIHRLSTASTSFFIHVDQKTDDQIYKMMVDGVKNIPNVYFLERHKCYWGDFGHVKATIKGIHQVLNKNIDFDYLILLTGQDYPLKSNRQIEQFFQESQGKSYMSYIPLPCSQYQVDIESFLSQLPPDSYHKLLRSYQRLKQEISRIEYWHFYLFNKYFSFPPNGKFQSPILSHIWSLLIRFFPKKHLPKWFPPPYIGCSYWCLSREIVEYVHHFINQNPKFVDFFQSVRVPDEIFFQTIIINSPFADKVINKSLRYIRWSNPKLPTDVLGKKDFAELMGSSEMFARKFDPTQDRDILDWLDQEIDRN